MTEIPDWFWAAIEAPRDTGTVEVSGSDVCWQAWGKQGAPGLLLVHGMFAHMHWWDFIAPQLADRFRIAALDLTGMGDSDYRYEYDSDTWADELCAVADAAGLGSDTVIIGHSFGGRIGLHAAVRHADRFAGLILADAGVASPEDGRKRAPMRPRPVRYPDAETARQRFRLQPPQPCEHTFLIEYIARHSVMAVDGGWAFKFDTDLITTMRGATREDTEQNLRTLTLPLALLYGAASELISQQTLDYMHQIAPRAFEAVALPDARHHLFLDQPLAFTQTLPNLLGRLGEAQHS